MSQSLVQIYVHLVFSTKHREPFLQDEILRAEMHKYLGGAFREQGTPSLLVGGVADHVHILCRLSRTASIADVVGDVKRQSSIWIKTKDARLAKFHWQDGYGAFSLSPSHVDILKEYIADQAEHHIQESYQDEFLRLLRKHDVEFDERYVWD